MTKEKLDNEQNNGTIDGFTTINDLGNLSWSFLQDLSRSFNGKGYYKDVINNGITFSGEKFYAYGDDVFMFEYDRLDSLNEDLSHWKGKLKKINSLTTETIDGKQILEPSGYFEYNGKYYLLGFLYQDLNEEDNDENNGVYKGVIVNPKKYFKLQGETTKFSGKVDGIL